MKSIILFNKNYQIVILTSVIILMFSCSLFQPSFVKTDGVQATIDAPDYKSSDTLLYFEGKNNVWIMQDEDAQRIAVLNPRKPEDLYYRGAATTLSPDNQKVVVGVGAGSVMIDFEDKGNVLISQLDGVFPGVKADRDNFEFWSPDSTKFILRDINKTNLYGIVERGKAKIIKEFIYSPEFIDSAVWLSNTELVLARGSFIYSNSSDTLVCDINSTLKISIYDIQNDNERTLFEGYGNPILVEIMNGKVYFIGGESICPTSAYEFDPLKSELIKYDLPVEEPGVLFCQTKSPDNTMVYITMDMWHLWDKSIYTFDKSHTRLIKEVVLNGYPLDIGCIERRLYYWTNKPSKLILTDGNFFRSGIFEVDLLTSQITSIAGNPAYSYNPVNNIKPIDDYIFTFSVVNLVGATKSGSIIILGIDSGNIEELFILNPVLKTYKRLGDEVFWQHPIYRGESSDGYLAVEATDIENNSTNVYILDSEGNLVQTINNSQMPAWIP